MIPRKTHVFGHLVDETSNFKVIGRVRVCITWTDKNEHVATMPIFKNDIWINMILNQDYFET